MHLPRATNLRTCPFSAPTSPSALRPLIPAHQLLPATIRPILPVSRPPPRVSTRLPCTLPARIPHTLLLLLQIAHQPHARRTRACTRHMPFGDEHHLIRISLRIENRYDQCDHDVDERSRLARIAANGTVRLSLEGDLEFPVAATLEIDGEAPSALPVDCTSSCSPPSQARHLPAPSGSGDVVYHVCRGAPLAVSELVIRFPSGALATPDKADVFRASAATFDPAAFKVEIPYTEWNTFSNHFVRLSKFLTSCSSSNITAFSVTRKCFPHSIHPRDCAHSWSCFTQGP